MNYTEKIKSISMKKIGLVGGISWTSTIDYYKYINEGINEKLGGLNFAEMLIYSLNFGDVQKLSWDNAFEILYKACENLKKSGAEAIALGANTAHLYADEIQEKIQLPIIHIATATASEIKKNGITKVGLLGTKFTMEMDNQPSIKRRIPKNHQSINRARRSRNSSWLYRNSVVNYPTRYHCASF
jgi:aspartate racemase